MTDLSTILFGFLKGLTGVVATIFLIAAGVALGSLLTEILWLLVVKPALLGWVLRLG